MEESTEDFYQRITERRNQERTAIKSFVKGVIQGDLELFLAGLQLVKEHKVELQNAIASGQLVDKQKLIQQLEPIIVA